MDLSTAPSHRCAVYRLSVFLNQLPEAQRIAMRYTISHLSITENLPACPACGATTTFAKAADVGRDNRVYLIFRCTNCDAGETKVWRPEYQAMADMLIADD
jgi:hypothetical protein